MKYLDISLVLIFIGNVIIAMLAIHDGHAMYSITIFGTMYYLYLERKLRYYASRAETN